MANLKVVDADNLDSLFTGIGNAIRTKEKSSGLIPNTDMAQRILDLKGGNGGDYDITAEMHDDGTQTLHIMDAEGGGGEEAGGLVELPVFDGQNTGSGYTGGYYISGGTIWESDSGECVIYVYKITFSHAYRIVLPENPGNRFRALLLSGYPSLPGSMANQSGEKVMQTDWNDPSPYGYCTFVANGKDSNVYLWVQVSNVGERRPPNVYDLTEIAANCGMEMRPGSTHYR